MFLKTFLAQLLVGDKAFDISNYNLDCLQGVRLTAVKSGHTKAQRWNLFVYVSFLKLGTVSLGFCHSFSKNDEYWIVDEVIVDIPFLEVLLRSMY